MFKPHVGICVCHGKERMIVVKAGLCAQGNENKKGKLGIRPALKRVAVNKVSDKRKVENRMYLKYRTEFLNRFPQCQFKDCNCSATDVHHKKGRGEFFLNCFTWMAVCRKHHTWIETHPKESTN